MPVRLLIVAVVALLTLPVAANASPHHHRQQAAGTVMHPVAATDFGDLRGDCHSERKAVGEAGGVCCCSFVCGAAVADLLDGMAPPSRTDAVLPAPARWAVHHRHDSLFRPPRSGV